MLAFLCNLLSLLLFYKPVCHVCTLTCKRHSFKSIFFFLFLYKFIKLAFNIYLSLSFNKNNSIFCLWWHAILNVIEIYFSFNMLPSFYYSINPTQTNPTTAKLNCFVAISYFFFSFCHLLPFNYNLLVYCYFIAFTFLIRNFYYSLML